MIGGLLVIAAAGMVAAITLAFCRWAQKVTDELVEGWTELNKFEDERRESLARLRRLQAATEAAWLEAIEEREGL